MVTSPKIVRISTENVGTNFACVAIIKARNGRIIWTSQPFPNGFGVVARKAAEAKCEEMGWVVAKEAS